MSFIEGYIWGLGMIIFIGPVFFTLLKSALNYGFWPGMMVVFGIFLSDVLVVVLCSFGAIPFFKDPANQFYLGMVGSVVLFGLGLKYLLRPNVNVDADLKLKAGHYTAYFVKGFAINFINPFVFLVWIGIIGFAQGKYGVGEDLWLFLAAVLLGILTTDTVKVIFADRIKVLISPKFLLRAYQFIGIILIGFALRMLWHVL